MTRSEVIRLVAGREIRERLRSKSFRISAGVSLAFILAIAILPSVFDDEPTTYEIGVFGGGAEPLAARLPVVAGQAGNVEVSVLQLADEAEASRLVESGDVDAGVGDGRVLVDRELGDQLGFLIQEANRQVTAEAALAGAGVSEDVAGRILAPAPLEVRALDPESKEENTREGVVLFGTLMLYGQLLGFGYWVASGVVEEKSSRVVEILLAKARPAQLLAGKVVGIGVLGFVQLVGFVVIGLVTVSVTGSVDLPSDVIPIALQVVAWFVLGFALYSCLFAVAGAIASRSEELQSTTTPLTFLTMASFFAATTAGGDPGGRIAEIATFVPFSAPMVLPIRMAAGEIGVGAVVLSVAIVLASIAGAMWLAGRVYAGGALHLRGQLKVREAFRAQETSGVGA